jgi:2,3-bisphosphoglycerate-dependent phosphoglycerate mutase
MICCGLFFCVLLCCMICDFGVTLNVHYSTPVHTLLLLRHGDSVWNGGETGTHERFTGWTDVDLSHKGRSESDMASEQIASYAYKIDALFVSTLKRAQDTARRCLSAKPNIPLRIVDYRLNERHYGALQGYIKREIEEGKYGHDKELVTEWRRSWHAVPPPLSDSDPRRIREIEQWGRLCGGAENVPKGESLQMVARDRAKPFLKEVIAPRLDYISKMKKPEHRATGLIVAHANSLRALIGVICNVEGDLSALKILESLKIPTGTPLVLNFQRTPKGNYHVCEIPEADDCVVDYFDGFGPPQAPPTDLGHPCLPVWPLNKCTPIQTAFDGKICITKLETPEECLAQK